MQQQLITLVTDWGSKDHFVGMVKAKLYGSAIPNLRVIDISHEVPLFDTRAAAFIVKHACLNFPPGTIHIVDINSIETKESSHIVIQYKGQYFICTDNGLPSLVFTPDIEKPEKVIEIDIHQDSNFYTFAGLDIFSKVAIELASGKSIEEVGSLKEDFLQREWPKPIYQNNILKASIIYIDIYGNAYLNVKDHEFFDICNGRKFSLSMRGNSTEKLQTAYTDVPTTEMLLTVSATGLLQIALNKASLEQLAGARINDNVIFEFR